MVNTNTAIPHRRPRWTGQLLPRLRLPPSTSKSMHPPPPPGPSRTSIGKLNNFFNSRLSTTAKRPTTVPAPRDSQSPSQIRSRAGSAKTKGGMSDFGSDFLGSNQIGTPNDLVRLTHLGFNTSSEDFSGLLKEWKQLLRMSGISRVGSIILGGTGSVIDPPRDEADWSSGVQYPVSRLVVVACVKDPQWLVQVPCWRSTQRNAIRTTTTTTRFL